MRVVNCQNICIVIGIVKTSETLTDLLHYCKVSQLVSLCSLNELRRSDKQGKWRPSPENGVTGK
jgi:hypothetical protein